MDEVIFEFKKIKIPTLAFIFYILLIPFESVIATKIVVMVSYATLMALLTSLMVLIYLLFKPKLLRLTKTSFAWIAFFLWSGLSIYWSIDRSSSIYNFIFISKHVFFLLLISSYPFNYSEKRAIRHAIILSGILLAATVFFNTFQIGGFSNIIRATISNGYYKADPNHIASTLLLPISFLVVDFVERNKFNVLDLVSAIILFSTLVYTGSRGAFIAFLILITSLIIQFVRQRQKKKAILSVAFVLAGFALIISLVNPDLFSRFAKVNDLDRYSSNRLKIWGESLVIAKEKPLEGFGFGTYGAVSERLSVQYKTAHNIFIQAYVEGGVISLLLIIIAIIPAINLKVISSFDRAAKAGVIGVFVSGIFLYTINYDYFWLAIIVAEIANRSNKRKATPVNQSDKTTKIASPQQKKSYSIDSLR